MAEPAPGSTMVHRQAVLDAFAGAGIRTATRGQLTAPCVLVEPGDPWSSPVRLPARRTRWRLTAIAGHADTEGGLAELARYIDAIDTALGSVAGVSLPEWARPRDLDVNGIRYGVTTGTISLETH